MRNTLFIIVDNPYQVLRWQPYLIYLF